MSRPSRAEERELEQLECLAALVTDIVQATGILSIRMRQILRRVNGDRRLVAVAGPAGQELARIADRADEIHLLLGEILESRQRERAARNRGA